MRDYAPVRKGSYTILRVANRIFAAILIFCMILFAGKTIIYDTKGYHSPIYLDVLSGEENFYDTETFAKNSLDMMQDAMHDIILYPVLQSQFENVEWVNVRDYSNRKNNVYISEEEDYGREYLLSDLLAWNDYDTIDELILTAREILYFFGEPNTSYLDGNLSVDERWILEGFALPMEKILETETTEQLKYYQALAHEIKALDGYLETISYYELPNADPLDTLTVTVRIPVLTCENRLGQNIAVESFGDYLENYRYFQSAAVDLQYNHKEYVRIKSKFENGALADFRYVCIFRDEMGNTVETFKNTSDSASHFENYKQYVIYSDETGTLKTNIGRLKDYWITEEIERYSYMYRGCSLSIGYVGTQSGTDDFFKRANDAYSSFQPVAVRVVSVGLIALLGLLVTFVLLTAYAGRETTSEGKIVPRFADRIPREIMLVIVLAIGAFLVGANVAIGYMLLSGKWIRMVWQDVFLGISVFIVGTLLLECWLSLIRRIRSHTYLKTLLTWRFLKDVIWKALCTIGRVLDNFCLNGPLFVRKILLPGILFFVNFLAGILITRYRHPYLRFIILLVFDSAIVVIYYLAGLRSKKLLTTMDEICAGNYGKKVEIKGLYGDELRMAKNINSIGEGIQAAVATSVRDERMKSELITNVSHDLKTPLTSIINYVDLLKREHIETEPVKGYIEVLDAKSRRLKQLTEDLIEASKASTGNIEILPEKLNLTELLRQVEGEFEQKLKDANLSTVLGVSESPVFVLADGRRVFRILENLYGNLCKYAMEGTRVYTDVQITEHDGRKFAAVIIKNISRHALNIKPDELMERFTRGEASRTSEGSGLGLSIAKSLTLLMGGLFSIEIDGDLFKTVVEFPVYVEKIA